MFNNLFSPKSRLLKDNVVKYCTVSQVSFHNIKRRMRILCWTPKATDTHSQYVTLITFPRRQRLHERASVLRYTNISRLVSYIASSDALVHAAVLQHGAKT